MEPLSASALMTVAKAVCSALAGKATGELVKKLRADPTESAFEQALAGAISKYATTNHRLKLAQPLLSRSNNPLASAEAAEELSKVLPPSSGAPPDYGKVAALWGKRLGSEEAAGEDLEEEVRTLLLFLDSELRSQEVFRPAYDSDSLTKIAENAEASVGQLRALGEEVAHLASLIDSRFGELAGRFRHLPPGVRGKIRDFSSFIRERTRHFVGRTELFARLDHFIESHRRGYFVVRGEPGIGKSAFAAQLVRSRGWIHHFNIAADGVNMASAFLENVYAQLVTLGGLDRDVAPRWAAPDSGILMDLLEELAAKPGTTPLLIVVDGLDEVSLADHTEGANVLYLPSRLPEGVFVLATLRPDERVPLRIDCESQTFLMHQASKGNMEDIQAYLENAVARPGIRRYLSSQEVEAGLFIATLKEKSQGNFIYLRYLLSEMESDAMPAIDFRRLPRGLENYYEDHWRRMKKRGGDSWFEMTLPVIVALTLVKEPVSIDRLSRFSRIAKRARIAAILTDLKPFLFEVQEERTGGRIVSKYRFYHQSFIEFLKKKSEVEEERIDLEEGGLRIVDSLLDNLPRR